MNEKAIKEYLLGTLSDEAGMRLIEEKLLLDDVFAEQLLFAEYKLIDDYLDGVLTRSERSRFVEFFLKPKQRKEKLRLTENIRKHAQAETQTVERASKNESSFDWRSFVRLPSFQFATAILLLLIAGFVVWRVAIYESDVDKGLAQLRNAYRGQRPTESRSTANFDYAPLTATRGDGQTVTDEAARARAQLSITAAAGDPTDAEAHHALGILLLAARDFDRALTELNLALKLAPNDARINSDLGAAYLEKAKIAKLNEKDDEFAAYSELSLKHLNRALQLDENLREALFNKALMLQKNEHLSYQAREAWEKYLEKDSTSQWADEARKQIQKLDSERSQNLSADEREKAFVTAFKLGNETEARELISRNREMITESYLPQRLAMSLVGASGAEKEELQQALIYAGELEKKYTGDPFAYDLAVFYRSVSGANLEFAKNALALTREAYKLCIDVNIPAAMEKFEAARELFLQAGDIWQAKLTEYFIVYCSVKRSRFQESILPANEIISFCRPKNYKWLLSNTLLWFGVAQRKTNSRSDAKRSLGEGLELAEEIGDSFMLQSLNLELAKMNKFVGRDKEAVLYLQRAFKNGSALGASLRQRWRNSSDGAEILAKVNNNNLALAVSLENLRLSEELQNSSFINYSQIDVGIAHARVGNYDEAKNWFTLAKKNAEQLSDEGDRKDIFAKTSLELGHLERKLGNYRQAANFYSEALSYDAENAYYIYETRKNDLLVQISLGNEAEIEKQLLGTTALAKEYRAQISAQESETFFGNEQTIYDIAVAYDIEHGRPERAYDFLETSNSRILLDWLKHGVEIAQKKEEIEITFKDHTEPLPLGEIRPRMPDRVQILQYAVLEKKIVIFAFSNSDFNVESVVIDSEKLDEKVAAYVQLISDRDARKQEEAKALARELYDLLISPIVAKLDPNREICVIPHKSLFRLPFAALTAADGKPFLSQFNFFYAPSANAFLLFTENARQKAAQTNEFLLTVGNPRFDYDEFKDLEDLPEAKDEAENIRQFYPASQPLIGANATKTAFQNSLKDAEVINFAGHYLVKDGEPLASALVLATSGSGAGPESCTLTNAEMISQQLPKAKLVVLSACQTGIERFYNGEGLVGLSTTFLKAGAPLVVASQWKVDSGAAAQLIKQFHFFRKREKLSTAAALRRAQLEMIDSPDERFRQPFFWAAFATYGGFAEF